jgi:tetratricopeptide (TPR) repeat protein
VLSVFAGGGLVDQTVVEALRIRAEEGDAAAQYDLGLMYYHGQGVTQDYAEAAKWYRMAAEQGNAFAQIFLGTMYASGRGIAQDAAEAVKWSRMSAEQGNAFAEMFLGTMEGLATGVPQEFAEQVKGYRMAAERGNADAQFLVGWMYYEGEGGPEDYVQAHMWMNLATSRSRGENREAYAKQREHVADLMTPEQVAKAQRLAREWQPKTWDELGVPFLGGESEWVGQLPPHARPTARQVSQLEGIRKQLDLGHEEFAMFIAGHPATTKKVQLEVYRQSKLAQPGLSEKDRLAGVLESRLVALGNLGDHWLADRREFERVMEGVRTLDDLCDVITGHDLERENYTPSVIPGWVNERVDQILEVSESTIEPQAQRPKEEANGPGAGVEIEAAQKAAAGPPASVIVDCRSCGQKNRVAQATRRGQGSYRCGSCKKALALSFCPECDLAHPPSAEQCRCGYVLTGGQSGLPSELEANKQAAKLLSSERADKRLLGDYSRENLLIKANLRRCLQAFQQGGREAARKEWRRQQGLDNLPSSMPSKDSSAPKKSPANSVSAGGAALEAERHDQEGTEQLPLFDSSEESLGATETASESRDSEDLPDLVGEKGIRVDFTENALRLIRDGRPDEALDVLTQAIGAMPTDWTAIRQQGEDETVYCWDLEEFRKYSHYRTSAGFIDWYRGSYSQACCLAGSLHIDRGDLPEALRLFDLGLELEPNHPELMCEKAYVHQVQNQHQQALDLFRQAETSRPWITDDQKARALRGQGVCLVDLDRLDEAEQVLVRAEQVYPEDTKAAKELEFIRTLRAKPSS